jgi:hypothetical protein
MRLAARLVVAGAWFVIASFASNRAHAQAWVGDTHSLDLSLDYNFGRSTKILSDGGKPDFPDAGTTSHQLTLGAEYTPIPHLAATVGLPLSFLKYTGLQRNDHPAGGSYDDGDTHATLTDLRAGARYQVLEDPIALSPHLAFSIPVADYETIGATVGGRGLKQLHAGLGIGYVFGASTYVHLMYEFSLVEKADQRPDLKKHSQNHSDLAFTVGHKLLQQRLDIHLGLNLRETHGGIGFDEFPPAGTELSIDELMFHDVILDEDIVLLGGGVGYELNKTLTLNFSARAFVAGANTQNATVIALGVSWTAL